MPDYGQPLRFGSFVTPSSRNPQAAVALARHAEAVGLDLVTFQDHPYQPAFLDTWTLMSYVAARTGRIAIAPNVVNLPLRPPAVLARAAASLDLLSGGRFELALGAGGFGDAIEAMGGPRRTPKEALTALEEAIGLIRALWDTGTRGGVRVDGAHYRAGGAKRGPAPAHPMSIWVGGYRPRMLSLIGRTADGWLPSAGFLGPERLTEASAILDEAAVASGRAPGDIRRLYNVDGEVGTRSLGFLRGPVDQWAEELAGLTLRHGTSTFILASDEPESISRWAGEIAPAVRQLVDRERGDHR